MHVHNYYLIEHANSSNVGRISLGGSHPSPLDLRRRGSPRSGAYTGVFVRCPRSGRPAPDSFPARSLDGLVHRREGHPGIGSRLVVVVTDEPPAPRARRCRPPRRLAARRWQTRRKSKRAPMVAARMPGRSLLRGSPVRNPKFSAPGGVASARPRTTHSSITGEARLFHSWRNPASPIPRILGQGSIEQEGDVLWPRLAR